MEMKDRIAQVIENSKLNKSEFAKRIGVSSASVSQWCSGTTTPSAQTVLIICKEFGCSRPWLSTGEGEPFPDRKEQILAFAAETVDGTDEFKKAFVAMLAKMDAEDWKNLATLFQKISGEMQKE